MAVTFRLHANEPVRFTRRVDGRPGKRCGTHYLTPTLHAGRHALHVAAKHPAGNRGTATKRFRLVTR